MALCPNCVVVDEEGNTVLDDRKKPRLLHAPLRLVVIDQPGTKRGLIIAQWCECGYCTDPRVKAEVAQLVERRVEGTEAAGSRPALGTT
jgi:hypothetical protein